MQDRFGLSCAGLQAAVSCAALYSSVHSWYEAHRMTLLLVSAMNAVPSGPSAKPPGSDSLATAPRPSPKPALPAPANDLIAVGHRVQHLPQPPQRLFRGMGKHTGVQECPGTARLPWNKGGQLLSLMLELVAHSLERDCDVSQPQHRVAGT